jgi:DNA polymerase-3 subunit delta'
MARRAAAAAETEALPEIDRLEGFPHPRETVTLYGHDAAERELAAAFAGGRVHHAWMLSGPAGIGKATLAYRVARYALAAPEERTAVGDRLAIRESSIVASQVRALSHPGLAVVRRAYNLRNKRFPATIPVDEVRELKTFLGRTADEGTWRVVIVDSADELNLNAANALLKALEEPPRRTLFLLVVAQPQRLLRTIRSRCRTLEMSPLGPEDLRRAATAALAAGRNRLADTRSARRGKCPAPARAIGIGRPQPLSPDRNPLPGPAAGRLAGRARARRRARQRRSGSALCPFLRSSSGAYRAARAGGRRRDGKRKRYGDGA